MQQQHTSLLDSIIDSTINPSPVAVGSRSLIVPNQLRQMKLFGIRQGVELYPNQDDRVERSRNRFIAAIWKINKLSILLPRIWDLFVGTGNIIFLLRPNEMGAYDIRFWGRDNYRTYYDDVGRLSEVVIVYSYKVKSLLSQHNGQAGTGKRWIRLTVTLQNISTEYFDMPPSLDGDPHYLQYTPMKEVYPNTLGFIPCVECNDNSHGVGQEGHSDFSLLKDQIESLEKNYASMDGNLGFFGGSTLVTTRSESEVLEAAGSIQKGITIAQRSGWESFGSCSAEDVFPRQILHNDIGSDLRMKKVIGNVDPTERFAFLTPDPVTPDHARHVVERREAIHFAMGGIDELGIRASASAYEMKTIYGKVAATAKMKAESLYTHGLCKIFEMAIEAEENLYMTTAAQILNKEPQEFGLEELGKALEKNKLPPRMPGLIPYGDRTIDWRWTGEVFEDSPRDILDKSIVTRNLQEQGVNSLDALSFLLPTKTEEERKAMLAGGYPFRYINSIAGTLNQLLALYGNSLQVPDPNNPSAPLAANINILPFIMKGLETISVELSYQKPNEPTSTISSSYGNSPGSGIPSGANAIRSQQPAGVRPSVPNPGVPANPYGSFWAAGISPGNPEFYAFGTQPTSGGDDRADAESGISDIRANDQRYGIPLEQSVVSQPTVYPQQSQAQSLYESGGLSNDPIARDIWGSPENANSARRGRPKS